LAKFKAPVNVPPLKGKYECVCPAFDNSTELPPNVKAILLESLLTKLPANNFPCVQSSPVDFINTIEVSVIYSASNCF
jgi:hypothetical protein